MEQFLLGLSIQNNHSQIQIINIEAMLSWKIDIVKMTNGTIAFVISTMNQTHHRYMLPIAL
jgi:hypothetical protein